MFAWFTSAQKTASRFRAALRPYVKPVRSRSNDAVNREPLTRDSGGSPNSGFRPDPELQAGGELQGDLSLRARCDRSSEGLVNDGRRGSRFERGR
jgi:hypothetical protein